MKGKALDSGFRRNDRLIFVLWCLCAILFALCGGPVHAADRPPGHAVATAHPLATEAGIGILSAGGNAFDAAVTISAVLAVVEPYNSGIGGGGFWLLHRARDGFESMVDGRETAPLAAGPDFSRKPDGRADEKASRDGPRSAAIPGAPAAWVQLAREYGTLPLPRLLEPAIVYAREGFSADARLVQMLSRFGSRLSPDATRIFMPGGKLPAEGTRIRQPDLARTLEALARQGHDGFYAGPVAQALVREVRRAGGVWTAEDLSRYRVVEREPQRVWFRDYRVTAATLPSAGGVALAQMLQMLEALAWPPGGRVESVHLLAEVMRRAYRDRLHLGDPDFVEIPQTALTSRGHALGLARDIHRGSATPSESLPLQNVSENTTHFSVLDAQGNRVAATLSINLPFGSGFVAAGTGVLLNDEMDDFSTAPGVPNAYGLVGSQANAIAPGKRPLSSMTPAFVEGPRGLLILGTPGGSRIITMVLLGVLGFAEGLELSDIVSQGRFHHQYLPDQLQFEPGTFTSDEQTALQHLGHALRPLDAPYGNLQAIWWQPAAGRLEAASDPRGIGSGRVLVTLPASAAAAGSNPR
jgi:gamma-glutamyltranspeptidase / glutathione hydrolase